MTRYLENLKLLAAFAAAAMLCAMPALAFDSGSTGADGAFNPTVNTEVILPPSGVFNYTSVNIPAGVTVTFRKNTTNTPVVILASGNVTVAGVINLNGTISTNVGAAGDGNLGDDGIPGRGGPGGYDGGRGGAVNARAGNGIGPGAGVGGVASVSGCGGTGPQGGGGGGFGSNGLNSNRGAAGGAAYGSSQLLPLIGGSGGGGGGGGNFGGSGGGGGGGAILIAVSGTLSVTGQILANGAPSGQSSGPGFGAFGGGGSGGAIRLMATTLTGNGAISAVGADVANPCEGRGDGGTGRIRVEAESITRTAGTAPAHPPVTVPAVIFVAGFPTLRITSVAGVATPAEPTGTADVTLPSTTTNPVTVAFQTTNVPLGNTVALRVTPANAAAINVVSPALTGTAASATASVDVTIPSGPMVFQATTTFTLVAALGRALGYMYANGEQVEKIELGASLGGESTATLITVSGKRYPIPSRVAAMPAAG